jgi:hypothetical protein
MNHVHFLPINSVYLKPCTWLQYITQKHQWPSIRLHGITPHKIVLPIVTAVREPQIQYNKTIYDNVRFQVLTAVVIKSTIFWDTTPCSLLKVNGRFGGTYRLQLQGQRICWARNQRESRVASRQCLTVRLCAHQARFACSMMLSDATCEMLYLYWVHTKGCSLLCAELIQFQRHYHGIIKIL